MDCLGLILAVAVSAAGVQDRDATVPLLEQLRARYFSIRLVWADGGVAQTLLAAVQLMVENLRSIESFLRTRRLWMAERYTIGAIPETPDPYKTTTRTNESDVTTPPPETSRT